MISTELTTTESRHVSGCIWTSRSGQLIDPVLDAAENRLSFWHVLESRGGPSIPGEPDTGRDHHLFPDEALARAYAATCAGCRVYPHDGPEEARRQARVARMSAIKLTAEQRYYDAHTKACEAYGVKRPEGAPVGNRNAQKPEADRRRSHNITLSDAAWSRAVDTGNASQYIEQLILRSKRK